MYVLHNYMMIVLLIISNVAISNIIVLLVCTVLAQLTLFALVNWLRLYYN